MVAGEKPIFAGGGVTARYDFACNGLPVLIQLRIIKNSNTAARIAPKIATVRHKTERRAQLGLFMQFSFVRNENGCEKIHGRSSRGFGGAGPAPEGASCVGRNHSMEMYSRRCASGKSGKSCILARAS